MQIALSLGLGEHALGEAGTPPVIDPPATDPPVITRLVVDPQTPEGHFTVQLDVSETCQVQYVITDNAVSPSTGQIAAGLDHAGNPAAGQGTLLTTDMASYNRTLTPDLANGTYHLHAYPIRGQDTGDTVSFGPFTAT